MTLIDVIIPAYNEEKAIGLVVRDALLQNVRNVIVANNNSTDNTAKVAEQAGAIVVNEITKGYGSACLCAMKYIANATVQPHVVVFMDGDYSDHASQMMQVVQPIINNEADMVIGSRVLGRREKGSLTIQQRIGNSIATFLIKLFYGVSFTDLGPYRAIKYDKLIALKMQDKNYGWTSEMQVKAAKQKLKCKEVAVNYRMRIGESKVSGTLKGSINAGYKILITIFKYAI